MPKYARKYGLHKKARTVLNLQHKRQESWQQRNIQQQTNPSHHQPSLGLNKFQVHITSYVIQLHLTKSGFWTLVAQDMIPLIFIIV